MKSILLVVLLAGLSAGLAAQDTPPDTLRAVTLRDSARVTWDDRGITVRFPRYLSPDSITSETRVGDAFSGYEWRVILITEQRAYMAALVVPPTDSLTIHKIGTIDEAYRLGDLRACDRTTSNMVLRCNRLAQGLVRDIHGQLEIAIVDNRWLQTARNGFRPRLHLLVKVARETVWEEEVPIRWGGK